MSRRHLGRKVGISPLQRIAHAKPYFSENYKLPGWVWSSSSHLETIWPWGIFGSICDTRDVITWGKGAMSLYWAEAWVVTKHPTIHRTVPHNKKSHLAQNVNNVEVRKPYPGG